MQTGHYFLFQIRMRILSFLIALAIAGTIIVFPRIISTDMHSVPHGWLVGLMLGMSFCFVYGVGFVPNNRILRVIFSPLVAWPLVIICGGVILAQSPMKFF